MEYRFQKIPTNQIQAGGVALSESNRKELQQIVRVTTKSGFQRPVLILNAGNEFRLIAGTLQFLIRRSLNISETDCVVFEDYPPQELELLAEEFDRKNSNAVVEAQCILKLKTDYKIGQVKIAKILGVSKQIISDTKAINKLPKEILDDAILDQSVAKTKLIEIARSKVDDLKKIARYNLEKQNVSQGVSKIQLRELSDITISLQKARRVISEFEKRSEQEQIIASPSDIRDMEAELKLLSEGMSRLLKKYDASYSLKNALRSLFGG